MCCNDCINYWPFIHDSLFLADRRCTLSYSTRRAAICRTQLFSSLRCWDLTGDRQHFNVNSLRRLSRDVPADSVVGYCGWLTEVVCFLLLLLTLMELVSASAVFNRLYQVMVDCWYLMRFAFMIWSWQALKTSYLLFYVYTPPSPQSPLPAPSPSKSNIIGFG